MPFKNRFVILIGLCMICIGEMSEMTAQKCLTDEKMQVIFSENPAYQQEFDKKAKWIRAAKQSAKRTVLVTIPVHFIIVHNPGEAIGTGDNLSVDHILSQLQVMNEDFRRLNPDASNTPAVFATGDSEVEFCLATLDPFNNPTNGITRYETSMDFDENEFAIKQATGWPRGTYLNIWVAPTVGALGYAYVPSINNLPNPVRDGVVCRTSAFGDQDFATHPVYNLGRTVTHEIGHYLGLGHIWRTDGCGPDDGFDDTPLQDDENFGCRNHPSPSCENSGDMFMNYMDYVDDDCMNAFSEDQNTYMHLILNNSRSSLLNAASIVCSTTPPPLFGDLDIQNINCYGFETGVVTITAEGGIPDYQYSLDGVNYTTENNFSDLPAGDYIAYIEDDDGSQFEIEFSITQPDPIEILIEESQSPSCYNGSDGYITFSATGGAEPYLNTVINGIPVAQLEPFGQLTEGSYLIEVEDANNCLSSFEVELINPEELILEISDLQGIGCSGEPGFVEVETFGGTGEIAYSIDASFYTDINVFQDLSIGLYTLFAEDELGCDADIDFVIEDYTPISLDIEDLNHVSCAGANDASILLAIEGGNAPFEYVANASISNMDGNFQNLGAGDYDFVITDMNGCSSEISIEIVEPLPLNMELLLTNPISCTGANDASVLASAEGGTPPFQYVLNESISNMDGNFQNLEAGDYDIIITDINGCSSEISIEIEEPLPLNLELILTSSVSCTGANDASVIVSAEGGIGPFQYSINESISNMDGNFENLTAGDFDIIVFDINGCSSEINIEIEEPLPLNIELVMTSSVSCTGNNDGMLQVSSSGGTGVVEYSLDQFNFSEDSIFAQLFSDVYLITAMDENRCVASVSTEVGESPPILVELTSLNDVSCFGASDGSASLNIIGGTPPFQLSLDQEIFENASFQSLQPGEYVGFAMDALGCREEFSFTILEPLELQILNLTIRSNLCFGDASGSISFDVTGGMGEKSVYLNGIELQDVNEVVIDKLIADDYHVEIIDENGCSISTTYSISQPDQLMVDLIDISSDNGSGSGIVQIKLIGGTPPYTSNGQSFNQNESFVIEKLLNGTYEVTFTDDNGCKLIVPFAVPLNTSVITNNLLDQIQVYPNPSNGHFQIQWEDLQVTQVNILNLAGNELYNEKISQDTPGLNVQIEAFSSGIYFVRLILKNGEVGFKKIIMHQSD